MALHEVKQQETNRLPDFKDIPITAYYLGNVVSEGNYGPDVRHDFYDPEKKEYISYWGVTDFNVKLSKVRLGSLVKFTYLGKEKRKLKTGVKEMHAVKLLNDPDDLWEGYDPKAYEKMQGDAKDPDIAF